MVKQKKKRNKVYAGKDAANRRPEVIRIDAVKRNKRQLWWHENKRFVKPAAITVLVVAALVIIITEIVQLIFF